MASLSEPDRPVDSAATRPHDIEAIPNSGGGTTHYCRTCGAMGVGLAPTLPCPGPTEMVAASADVADLDATREVEPDV